MKPQGKTFTYYLVDCVNGSDQNDGFKKPFKTLDRIFDTNEDHDLRIRFLAAGDYPTAVQHFTGMSIHLVKGEGVSEDVNVIFNGKYPSGRIQFYNCYTHISGIRFQWDKANRLFFESGACCVDKETAFISDEVRFCMMVLYAASSSFYRLIVRECPIAKLHNITITKPGTDTQDAIHSRDSNVTLYGSLTIRNRMAVANTAAVILFDRGRGYLSASPRENTGYQYGIRSGKAELYIDRTSRANFVKYSITGNSVTRLPAYEE